MTFADHVLIVNLVMSYLSLNIHMFYIQDYWQIIYLRERWIVCISCSCILKVHYKYKIITCCLFQFAAH